MSRRLVLVGAYSVCAEFIKLSRNKISTDVLFGKRALAMNGELTREKFFATMEDIGWFDLGGLVLRFGPDDHQGWIPSI